MRKVNQYCNCMMVFMISLSILMVTGIIFGQTSFKKVFDLKNKVRIQETNDSLIAFVEDLDIDSRSDIWISDWNSNCILKFDKSGKFKKIIAKKGKGPGDVYMVNRIIITKNDRVYTISALRVVKIFDIDGKYIDSFILTKGPFPSLCIKVNSKGNMIISGPMKRVDNQTKLLTGEMLHIYDPKGKYIKSFFKMDEKVGKFNLKSYISSAMDLDSNDNIYAVQSMDYKISVFDREGKILRHFGSKQKYYNAPGYLSLKVKKDKNKRKEFEKSFTYVMDTFVFDKKLAVLSRNHSDSELNEFRFFIDIYNRESGELIYGVIESDMLLYRVKNGKFYFLNIAKDDEDFDEEKILEIYRMK